MAIICIMLIFVIAIILVSAYCNVGSGMSDDEHDEI